MTDRRLATLRPTLELTLGMALTMLLPGMAMPVAAAPRETVRSEHVRGQLAFLAGDALRGRGSATSDEAIAAAYVASQFEAAGLIPAPGRSGYVETVRLVRLRMNGPAALSVDGVATIAPTLLIASGDDVSGRLAIHAVADPATMPKADVILVTARSSDVSALFRAARKAGVKLLIIRQTDMTRRSVADTGGPRLPVRAEGAPAAGGTTFATLPDAQVDALAARAGAQVILTVPTIKEVATTSNAIGYLPGREPAAGVILLTAHLDHLGVRPDGVVMHGANDDASGTVAVLELARAMAAGKRLRRGVLFVAYGSEEIGGYGSRHFAAHPPVPLTDIVANVEFEMVGAQDPKLPKGALMMTGYERSTLGAALRAHGAAVAVDPYPDQNFFERSDNYSLALAGVVAHTVSGWATVPTYHTPDDTIAGIDVPFMTRAIQSLIAPMRWLADARFVPTWNRGGRPVAK